MNLLRVAHAFRVLVAAFCRDELFPRPSLLAVVDAQRKFVAVEHRDQHGQRVRYPGVSKGREK